MIVIDRKPAIHHHQPPAWIKSIEVARRRILVALAISPRTATGLHAGTLAHFLSGCDRIDQVDELLADMVQARLVCFVSAGDGPNDQPVYGITPLGSAQVKRMIDNPSLHAGPIDPQAAARRKESYVRKPRTVPVAPNAFALDRLFSPPEISQS